ncbi:MAG: hypothetical protein BGO96_03250 [Micrococcales bacterium 73-15]|nr:MAG: hypothetical protein BGO96_03250 [Micrococcales bacterium 73-15]
MSGCRGVADAGVVDAGVDGVDVGLSVIVLVTETLTGSPAPAIVTVSADSSGVCQVPPLTATGASSSSVSRAPTGS